MPNYNYEDEAGNTEEVFMTLADREERIFKEGGRQCIMQDGRKLFRVFLAKGNRRTGVTFNHTSMALGVQPEQIAEQEKYDHENGVPTKYCRESGDAIYTSMRHHKKHLALHGMVDRS